MIHLVGLNPALDVRAELSGPGNGGVGLVREARFEAGGKAVNVFRFLSKWDVPRKLWLGAGGGGDPTHVLYAGLLRKEGIRAFFLDRRAPIRFNFEWRVGRAGAKYNHPGFELDLGSFSALDRALRAGDILVLAGSLPSGMNPSLYASWIRAYGRRDVRVLLDTSGPPLRKALGVRPWFFKVNLEEFSGGMGKMFRDLKQLRRAHGGLLRKGLLHGVVTNGREGALAWRGREILWIRPFRILERPLAVGAGDAFLAGYLRGLASHGTFEECCRWAAAAGEVVARRGIFGFAAREAKALVKNVRVAR